MINDERWAQIKQLFIDVFSWAQNTILFNLTINNVSVRLSILDFAFGIVAFDLIIGVIWTVLNRGGGSDD